MIGSSYAYLEAFIEPSSKCFQECGFAAPRGSKQKSNPGRLDDSADIFEDLDLGLVMAEAQLGREQRESGERGVPERRERLAGDHLAFRLWGEN